MTQVFAAGTEQAGHLYGPGIKVIMMPGSTILENMGDGSPGIKVMEASSLEFLGVAAGLYGSKSLWQTRGSNTVQ